MTKDTSYRLGRYEIIEKENGEVWWETHSGFGLLRAGKCFIEGKILFIGPYKTEEPGFLKGEFIEHLNKLSKWEKTKYYCSSYTICNCKTGRRSPELKTGQKVGKQHKCVKDNIASKETYDGGTTANLIYGAKAAMKVKKKIVGTWGLFKNLLRLCFR